MIEQTLSIVKPDAVERNLENRIKSFFKEKNFLVFSRIMLQDHILAINKIDLPAADPDKIRNELLNYEIIVEKLSGDVLDVEISALKKTNLERMNTVLFVALEIIRRSSLLLFPIMPQSCGKVLSMLNVDKKDITLNNYQTIHSKPYKINESFPVFPRIDIND